jgi:hypothetical protein
MLVTLRALLASAMALSVAAGGAGFVLGREQGPPAVIGGTDVPSLVCAEDELIGFLGPDRIGCLHSEVE